MIESHQYFSEDTDNGSSQNGNWIQILKSFNYYKPVTSALGALVLHLVRLKVVEKIHFLNISFHQFFMLETIIGNTTYYSFFGDFVA